MWSAVRTCYREKYFTFDGRATPAEFWLFHIFGFLVFFGALALGATLQTVLGLRDGSAEVHIVSVPMLVVMGGVLFGSIIPSFNVAVRRLHDTNASGAWLLLVFFPFIGALSLFIWSFVPGSDGDNRYGPDPRGGGTLAGPRQFGVS